MKEQKSVKNVNFDKLRAVLLYLLERTGKTDYYRVMKFLFFADKQHLKDYGRTIVVNDYVAMDAGPVPSTLYDIIKKVRDHDKSEVLPDFSDCIFVLPHTRQISAIQKPDLDELSKSDKLCLDKAIEQYSSMTNDELKKLSHGYAYEKVYTGKKNTSIPMSIYDIAKEAGASDEEISEIRESDIIFSILSNPCSDLSCKHGGLCLV